MKPVNLIILSYMNDSEEPVVTSMIMFLGQTLVRGNRETCTGASGSAVRAVGASRKIVVILQRGFSDSVDRGMFSSFSTTESLFATTLLNKYNFPLPVK